MRLSRMTALCTRLVSPQSGLFKAHLINPFSHVVCGAFPKQFRTSTRAFDLKKFSFISRVPVEPVVLPVEDAMTITRSYQEAVAELNSLQSNSQAIEKSRKERDKNAARNLQSMATLLKHLDIQVSDLDDLKIIHVSGTKGKGSTCAFTESLLRNAGCRTGFYSSPHLVSVRERIRLFGKPISEQLFTKYFWEVYNRLEERCAPGDMPPYFKFLTLMCFYVFIKERIDVAIVEVGIGGTYDSTNIIRKPVVCGVTSLGLDHMSLLGDTLPQIAAHKAGIFKRGTPVITVAQPSDAMAVLQNHANSLDIPLYTVPAFHEYPTEDGPVRLGLQGHVQETNAALALQLFGMWLHRENTSGPTTPPHDSNRLRSIRIDSIFKAALESCSWPGRFQRFSKANAQYYLDGAHTKDSVQYCAEWYKSVRNSGQNLQRFVLFNSTADRSPDDLLPPLIACDFDMALFCPNLLDKDVKATSDLANFTVSSSQQQSRCLQHAEAWKRLAGSGKESSQCFESVREAFEWIEKRGVPVEVLVTGSLHLVGAALTILDPTLGDSL